MKSRKAEFELLARSQVVADELARLPVSSKVDAVTASAVIGVLKGDSALFHMLDGQANRVGLNRGLGEWHWKLRQTRNYFGEQLFASLRG
jgi:hypothetical protein